MMGFEVAERVPCPVCEAPIPLSSLQIARVTSGQHIAQLRDRPWVDSSKISAIMAAIDDVEAKHPGDKIVLFSHFTSFLDIIAVALERRKKKTLRVDGSMGLDDRASTIRAFHDDPTVTILLASKMAVGVGLNLTCANHVFVSDPWWNPAVEEQAIHRCHRIGQTKTTYVKRFIVEESIEQYCFDIALKKKDFGDAIIRAATDQSSTKNVRQLMMQNILAKVTRIGVVGDEKMKSEAEQLEFEATKVSAEKRLRQQRGEALEPINEERRTKRSNDAFASSSSSSSSTGPLRQTSKVVAEVTETALEEMM